MKAGDVKKFLERVISTENRETLKPEEFSIHDSFILGAISAYKNNEPPQHITNLIEGYITTESLTVQRRIAVLKLISSVLIEMSKPPITKETRERLRTLLTAYFI